MIGRQIDQISRGQRVPIERGVSQQVAGYAASRDKRLLVLVELEEIQDLAERDAPWAGTGCVSSSSNCEVVRHPDNRCGCGRIDGALQLVGEILSSQTADRRLRVDVLGDHVSEGVGTPRP